MGPRPQAAFLPHFLPIRYFCPFEEEPQYEVTV